MQMNFRTIMLCVSLPAMPLHEHSKLRDFLIIEFARAIRGTMLDGVPVVFVPQGVGVFPIVASESNEMDLIRDAGPAKDESSLKEGTA